MRIRFSRFSWGKFSALGLLLLVLVLAACGSEGTYELTPAPPTPAATATGVPPPIEPTPSPTPESTTPVSQQAGLALAFSLPDVGGRQVSLSELLQEHEAVVIIFYRGYF